MYLKRVEMLVVVDYMAVALTVESSRVVYCSCLLVLKHYIATMHVL